MVVDPDHARRAARLHALRSISEKSRHRAQHADAAARCAGRSGAVGAPPLQRASAARRICADAARPRFSAGAGRASWPGATSILRRKARACCWSIEQTGKTADPILVDRVTGEPSPRPTHRFTAGPAAPASTRRRFGLSRPQPGGASGRGPRERGIRVSTIAMSADVPIRGAATTERAPAAFAHRPVAARPDRVDLAAAGLAEHPGHAGAGRDRVDRDLFRRPPRHRCARRHGAGVSRLDADADDLGRRHGRRHLVRDRARARRRAARRGRRAGAARRRHPRRAGLFFTTVMLAFGEPIYRALGGRGGELAAALAYSNVVFAGNVFIWILNALASAIRGTGNMLVPAVVICVGVVVLIPLSPCLIFGIGPLPALGIAGGGVALGAVQRRGNGRAWLVRLVRPQCRAAAVRAAALVAHRAASSASAPGRRSLRCRPMSSSRSRPRWPRASRRRRGRRLWHRRAARISAGPAGVRPRRAAGGDGRHQYRRRTAPARAAHRFGRRRDRVRASPRRSASRRRCGRRPGSRCSAAIRT